MKLLNQFPLQQQRLRLVAHDMKIKIVNRLDQCLKLQIPTHPPRGLEIVTHPLSQIPRLADINHRPESVPHQVDPRFMRERRQLFANVFGRGHALCKLQPRVGRWQGREEESEIEGQQLTRSEER